MGIQKKSLFYLITTLLLINSGVSQRIFDLNVNPTQFMIEGKQVYGYESAFDFGKEMLKKGWFSYTRKFGKPSASEDFFKVKIPYSFKIEKKKVKKYVTLYSKIRITPDKKIIYQLATEYEGYQEQLKHMIIEFKLNFYTDFYLDKLHEIHVSSAKYGNSYQKLLKNNAEKSQKIQTLHSIMDNKLAIDKLEYEIAKICRTKIPH